MRAKNDNNDTEAVKQSPVVYPFDWLIVGYSALILCVVAVFGRPISQYTGQIVFSLGTIALVGLIVRYSDESRGRVQAFIRILYPLILFTFMYRMTGGMMHVIFPGFFDWQLTAFEKSFFGFHPTIYIDRHLLHTIPNEIFSATYFSYYLMLPGFLFPVFFLRDYDTVKKTITALCLTFVISYVIFFAYPIEGPRWHFAAAYVNQIQGPVFRPLVEFVIEHGAVRGGAMPSSHVAVAFVVVLSAFRYYRKGGWVLLPFFIGLIIGTFWGRFHYLSDVAVGLTIGLFSTVLIWRYYDRWMEPQPDSGVERQQEIEHAT